MGDLATLLKEKRKEESSVDVSGLSYRVILADESVMNPFAVDSELVRLVNRRTSALKSERSKAKSIFDWCMEHINYGTTKKEFGYSNSLEVFRNREGICGEMAFLYIALTRSIGLCSSYVSVIKDFQKKRVRHACAVVYPKRDIRKKLFVDIAYQRFDIQHKKVKILSDAEAISRYQQWR